MGSFEGTKFWGRAVKLLRKAYLLPVLLYRKGLAPMLKPRCIYYPSCSEYFEQAVLTYGIMKGTVKGFYRILRCNPFAEGGYDPP